MWSDISVYTKEALIVVSHLQWNYSICGKTKSYKNVQHKVIEDLLFEADALIGGAHRLYRLLQHMITEWTPSPRCEQEWFQHQKMKVWKSLAAPTRLQSKSGKAEWDCLYVIMWSMQTNKMPSCYYNLWYSYAANTDDSDEMKVVIVIQQLLFLVMYNNWVDNKNKTVDTHNYFEWATNYSRDAFQLFFPICCSLLLI